MKIAFLSSTAGTNLPSAFTEGKKQGIDMIFITNKQNCGAQKKAKEFGIQDIWINPHHKTRTEYDAEIVALLLSEKVDYIFLIGYMKIISPLFLSRFPNKIYNIHPSLLPAFAGGMDTDVHTNVLQKGCKVSGATLHLVTEEVDEGPIIRQKACTISSTETSDSLKKKVQSLEQEMITAEIQALCVRKS